MTSRFLHDFVAGAAIAAALIASSPAPAADASALPHYTAGGRLEFPADYRQWVFLSSGLDMSYSDKVTPGMHMFNNVFVPRRAWAAFRKTGHWPDNTMLVLENRTGVKNRSILKHGDVQTEELMGLEVHVKDSERFKGGWGFFSFDGPNKPAALIAYDKSCYACHQAHGAVDTTFVQFYPTLMPVAKRLATLSAAYLAETRAGK